MLRQIYKLTKTHKSTTSHGQSNKQFPRNITTREFGDIILQCRVNEKYDPLLPDFTSVFHNRNLNRRFVSIHRVQSSRKCTTLYVKG